MGHPSPDSPFRLRTIHVLGRVGLTCIVLVMLGGLAASFRHVVDHHENRDERPGLSMDDVRGAYHGLNSEAPLRRALEANHPAEVAGAAALADADRTVLLTWLSGDRISSDYDNLDLGDAAPAEIIAAHCLSCHDRQGASKTGGGVPLEYWDDVKSVAFAREISRTGDEIIIASLHAHTLALATLALGIGGLLLATTWRRRFAGLMIGLMGVGLLGDLAGQWLTRDAVGFAWLIVIGGTMFGGAATLSLLAVLVELWRPAR
ncbi:MAG: hypothetical protein KDA25_05705 [Phycisphaerales bacterium]|nr:hypothetical protein [Phycisphaerales bacterium]